jgi:MFS family permease
MAAAAQSVDFSGEEKRVIFASSLGTVFEWYDFYLYAVLAPFFAALFFPPGNQTAALLSAFAAYAAGFLVRPFGALVFGRIGDMVGRKYTFLITIVVMGASTFAVGLLPTYATLGWVAPILMVSLRLLQGLALGGEYGGAASMWPSTRRRTGAAMTPAGSRPRQPSACFSHWRSSIFAAATWTRRSSLIGAGACRSGCP